MIFYTLENGKQPFQLHFSKQGGQFKGQVIVSKFNDDSQYNTCVNPYNPFTVLQLTNNTTVFVNSSVKPQNEATSVLIQTYNLETQKYSFVLFSGNRAISFVLPDNDYVSKFFAKITNENTPQPLIVGKQNVYFMAKDVNMFLPLNMIVGQMTDNLWENLYNPFYGKKDSTANLRTISSPMTEIQDIQQNVNVSKK